jgi:hypothetical protein
MAGAACGGDCVGEFHAFNGAAGAADLSVGRLKGRPDESDVPQSADAQSGYRVHRSTPI